MHLSRRPPSASPVEGRKAAAAVRIDTPDGPILIIDESYNTNPVEVAASKSSETPRTRFSRRVPVLGDMLKLGHDGPQFHAELASAVNSNGIDLVFCAGPLMANLYEQLPKQKRGGWSQKSEDLLAVLLDAVGRRCSHDQRVSREPDGSLGGSSSLATIRWRIKWPRRGLNFGPSHVCFISSAN